MNTTDQFLKAVQANQVERILNQFDKDIKIIHLEKEQINGILYAIVYTDIDSKRSQRYHKIVVDGALSSLNYHDSNVIDKDIRPFTIEELREQYKRHLTHTLNRL